MKINPLCLAAAAAALIALPIGQVFADPPSARQGAPELQQMQREASGPPLADARSESAGMNRSRPEPAQGFQGPQHESRGFARMEPRQDFQGMPGPGMMRPDFMAPDRSGRFAGAAPGRSLCGCIQMRPEQQQRFDRFAANGGRNFERGFALDRRMPPPPPMLPRPSAWY